MIVINRIVPVNWIEVYMLTFTDNQRFYFFYAAVCTALVISVIHTRYISSPLRRSFLAESNGIRRIRFRM